tara:strand:- start:1576 stop:1818 length:243 start_codon:yes stop_codon:yes gene_type:complete
MTLQEAIDKADSIFAYIWMEAGASGYEVILTKEDTTKACVEFLTHEFDKDEQAIYNKEGRAVAYIDFDGNRGWILRIGSC